MLSLLTATTLATSLTASPLDYRSYCELAPGFGRAASEEGGFDARNSLQVGCGRRLLSEQRWSLWFGIAAKELRGALYQPKNDSINVRDFQTRSAGLGLAFNFQLNSLWTLGLDLENYWGKGSLEQNFSTNNVRQTLRFKDLNSREWQLGFTAQRFLRPELALLASLEFGREQWSWDPTPKNFFGEAVSTDKRLSLTSNPSTWQGPPITGTLRSQVRDLKFAVRFLF